MANVCALGEGEGDGSVRGAEGWMMGMKGDGMRERGMQGAGKGKGTR
jgi:hypothetical protein